MAVTELRSCVKVEVAVLDSPSILSLMVFVDIKHRKKGAGRGGGEGGDEEELD